MRKAVAKTALTASVKPWEVKPSPDIFTTSSEEEEATFNTYLLPRDAPRKVEKVPARKVMTKRRNKKKDHKE